MKTYRFTSNAEANALAAPVSQQGVKTFDFSYFTLCKIADAIHRTYPTPEALASYCKHNLNGADCELTVDELGNFVSLVPADSAELIPTV